METSRLGLPEKHCRARNSTDSLGLGLVGQQAILGEAEVKLVWTFTGFSHVGLLENKHLSVATASTRGRDLPP